MSRVMLVGVGPGDPGLATMHAVEAIKRADVIRHTDGCGTNLLHFASPEADVRAFESTDELVQLARGGRKVTVLFPGSPYAFASGSEIATRLDRAGIDFEAVPGMTVEMAAPVMSGIPLTIEGRANSLGLGLVKGAETVVVRLASGWWEAGISKLMSDGRPADTPAALILSPGLPGQRRVAAPLGELARKAATYGLRGDALLVIGPGVEMAERLDSLSRRPLHGRRVLITRARHQVEPFRRELADLGAAVIEIPTIAIRPMPTDDRVREAIANLNRTALVIFASANAVDIFFQMLNTSGADARALHGSKLCAIGQETAESMATHGVRPELVTSEYTAEGLAKALEGWEMEGMRVLVPRAEVARDLCTRYEHPHALHLPPFEGLGEAFGGVLAGDQLRPHAVRRHRLRGLLTDRAQLAAVQRAGVSAAGVQHLEEDVDRIRRGEDDERGPVEVRDGLAHTIVGGHGPDRDRGYLDDRSAQVGELASERLDLVPGAGDENSPAMEGPARKRVEALGHLDARPDHEQRVAAEAVGGRLAGQLAQRRRHASLPGQSRAEDQRGRRVGGTPVRHQLADARLPPARRQPQHDSLGAFHQAEAERVGAAFDGEGDAAHHGRGHLDCHAGDRFEA